jgi:hypothetical protein
MAVTINGSGQLPVQVISTTKLDSFSTSSATMVDVTGLSATITPTNSANKILVTVAIVVSGANYNTTATFVNLVRNSTNLGIGTSGTVRNSTSGYCAYSGNATDTSANCGPLVISFLDSPNTTSATTYKVQITNFSATTAAVGRRALDATLGFGSTITATELSLS